MRYGFAPCPCLPSSENEDAYALSALIERWGKPAEQEVLAFVDGRTWNKLIADGAEVSMTRIDSIPTLPSL